MGKGFKRLITGGLVLLLVACSTDSYTGSEYSDNEGAVGNPYADGSGHAAGYDWAERTGGNCNGNSASFNEGCEEYYDQIGQ